MESTLRSMNNLLERLHASFFFYLLPHPGWFHKIGAYLPAAILLGAGMTIRGLGLWVDAGWELFGPSPGQHVQWRRRSRQTSVAAAILAASSFVSWCFYRLRHFVVLVSVAEHNQHRGFADHDSCSDAERSSVDCTRHRHDTHIGANIYRSTRYLLHIFRPHTGPRDCGSFTSDRPHNDRAVQHHIWSLHHDDGHDQLSPSCLLWASAILCA